MENGLNGHAEPDGIADLACKAPEEATTDDLFAEQATKTKGGKGKQGKVLVLWRLTKMERVMERMEEG